MRLKEFEIFEAATAGATSSGNIATVANPHVAHSKQKPKKVKPTDNALDMDVPLLSSKNPATIRRQIQEGSLYEVEPGKLPNFGKIKKTPYLDPEYVGASANSFDELMKQRSKDSAIVNTEKSKRRTAKAAGYDAIMKGEDPGGIVKPKKWGSWPYDDIRPPAPVTNKTPFRADGTDTRNLLLDLGKEDQAIQQLYRSMFAGRRRQINDRDLKGMIPGKQNMPYTSRPELKDMIPGKQNMPFTLRPELKDMIPGKQNMPFTPRPEEPKIPRGFEYDPDSGKNRDPGFTDNVWSRRLDKELKKRLGGRKPV